MAAIKWYKTGGKRYYVIALTGYVINPKVSGNVSGGRAPATSYAVLDRDWIHREMAVFTPGGGQRSDMCKKQAEKLAAELNGSPTGEKV